MGWIHTCRDIEHGERQDDPKPRIDTSLAYSWVSYFAFEDSPRQAYEALSCMWDKVPLLLRSSTIVSKENTVTFDRLVELCAAASSSKDTLEVMCSDSKNHQFMSYDVSKNDARGPYYVREFETQMLNMSMHDFVQCSRSWTKQKLYLKGRLFSSIRQRGAEGDGYAHEVCEGPLHGVGQYVLQSGVIDWKRLEGLVSSQRFGDIGPVSLEAGSKNGVLPLQYATRDVLHIQLSGRRRVTMISPEQAFGCLYPYPMAHPYDTYAMASIEKIDRDCWPGIGNASLQRAIVGPGEILYVPAFWFVHIHDLENENVSLQVPLKSHMRAPAADSTLLRVSRALEERVADVVGVSEVKRWFSIISSGNETKHVDLNTVKGYKCARMCQDIRDEMERSLGVGAWSRILPRVIDHRLEPTPWLNKQFREPLLLTDTPVRIEDTRTEEERKYPTLFRQKLEKEGWNVPKTVSTVPIPGYNMAPDQDYRLL